MWEDNRAVAPVDRTSSTRDGQELAPGQRIEARKRLIEQEDRRPRAKREGQGDLRLLPARQLSDQRSNRTPTLAQALLRVRPVEARASDASEAEVVGGGQVSIKRGCLRDVPDPRDGADAVTPGVDAFDEHAALVGLLEPHRGPDESRLAGAIGSDEGRDRAASEFEGDPRRAHGPRRR